MSVDSRSRSHSTIRSGHDNFMVVDSDASTRNRNSPRPASVEDPTQVRWKEEMKRDPPKKTKTNKLKGFGSFYQRKPGNYSFAEFQAEQGQLDRIRTADLTESDRIERQAADDHSHLPYDWNDRTSIAPEVYQARKELEAQNREHREADKRRKLETKKCK